MNVISKATLDEEGRRFPNAAGWLRAWYAVARKARWEKLEDVRRVYQTTDQFCCCLIFDVRGNNYRLICRVQYADQWQNGTLFIKGVFTHAEYDKDNWKENCK